MRVVSDTTPISELFKINRLDLLRLVSGALLIPEAVAHELRRAQTWPGLAHVVDRMSWISIRPLLDPDGPQRLRVRYPAVHIGEAAAMALAKEIDATRILLDDKRARQAARSEGLPLIGTVGVVLLACRLGRISAAEGHTILDCLYTGTAYISKRFYLNASRQIHR